MESKLADRVGRDEIGMSEGCECLAFVASLKNRKDVVGGVAGGKGMEERGVGGEESRSGAVEEYLARTCEKCEGEQEPRAHNRVRDGPCDEEWGLG